jgi:hypothetical protein
MVLHHSQIQVYGHAQSPTSGPQQKPHAIEPDSQCVKRLLMTDWLTVTSEAMHDYQKRCEHTPFIKPCLVHTASQNQQQFFPDQDKTFHPQQHGRV